MRVGKARSMGEFGREILKCGKDKKSRIKKYWTFDP
jgi:hypothetical protein